MCVYRYVYKGEIYYKNYLLLLIYIYKKRIYHFKRIVIFNNIFLLFIVDRIFSVSSFLFDTQLHVRTYSKCVPRRQKPVSRWFLRRSNDYCLQRIDRAVYADISYLLQWTMTWCIYLLRDNLWFLNNFLTINNKSYTINSTLILSFIKWYKFDIYI